MCHILVVKDKSVALIPRLPSDGDGSYDLAIWIRAIRYCIAQTLDGMVPPWLKVESMSDDPILYGVPKPNGDTTIDEVGYRVCSQSGDNSGFSHPLFPKQSASKVYFELQSKQRI